MISWLLVNTLAMILGVVMHEDREYFDLIKNIPAEDEAKRKKTVVIELEKVLDSVDQAIRDQRYVFTGIFAMYLRVFLVNFAKQS